MDNNRLQQNAVLATLAYHDIFDFPLSLEEIQKYCIATKSISLAEISRQLNNKKIEKRSGFYCLKGREANVAKRLEKRLSSKVKLEKAQKISQRLALVPTVLYIGVSGSLALGNASQDDDIDLFIITESGTLWISRLLVTLLLLLPGNLRTHKKKHVRDTFCTNMWIDTDNLSFPRERQNIYTAHEIVQMYTLYAKKDIYQQFLYANKWIQRIFAYPHIENITRVDSKPSVVLKTFEFLAKQIQLWYMKRHRTSEIVTAGFVAFHPKDYTKRVLSEWEKRLKIYGI